MTDFEHFNICAMNYTIKSCVNTNIIGRPSPIATLLKFRDMSFIKNQSVLVLFFSNSNCQLTEYEESIQPLDNMWKMKLFTLEMCLVIAMWVDSLTLFGLNLATHGGSIRTLLPRNHHRIKNISKKHYIIGTNEQLSFY